VSKPKTPGGNAYEAPQPHSGAQHASAARPWGSLNSMTRREDFQLVLDVGSHPCDGVTRATSLLVCGQQDIDKLAAGALMSHKRHRANELRRAGLDIEVVGELESLRML
jgi:hypothetical protein